MSDPIHPYPTQPLSTSYTYHSPISSWTRQTYLQHPESSTTESAEDTAAAENEDGKGKGKEKERWIMGIDEAGRGPVLGPMVYACAYAPLSFSPTLETLGFDDSKALSHSTRDYLFTLFQNPASSPSSRDRSDEEEPGEGYHQLHYATRVLSPGDISKDMLRGIAPVNLNKQAEEATVGLIADVLRNGVDIAECYVDALGACGPYQAKLSALFPTISFTVCPKADSLFKIVGAASIAAKITRDRWITHWIHPEQNLPYAVKPPVADEAQGGKKRKANTGEKGGKGKRKVIVEEEDEEDEEGAEEKEKEEVGQDQEVEGEVIAMGSGYPSDPTTKAFLRQTLDPIFGYPSLVRFSWSTVKVILDKEAKEVKWVDEVNNGNAKNFFSATPEDIADRERIRVWQEIGLRNVGEL